MGQLSVAPPHLQLGALLMPIGSGVRCLCLGTAPYFISEVPLVPSCPLSTASLGLPQAWCVHGTGNARKRPPALGPPRAEHLEPISLTYSCPVTLLEVYLNPHLNFAGPMFGGPTT